MAQEQSFIRPDVFWQDVGLKGEQVVVHLGCGAGFYLLPAAHIVGRRGKVIGVDILPDMLAEVESKAERDGVAHIVQTVRANLENAPGSSVPQRAADWVLVANILHQSDPTKILQEAKRVVAANGHVVVVEWDTAASPLGPPIEKRLPKSDARRVVKELGFVVDREIQPSPYHYGLILSLGTTS